MKMKKSMIAVLGLLAASASAAVPIEIRVTGTATTSGFGYAQGSDYTFTFMLTDSYPGTGGDFFGGFFGGDRTLWSNDGYPGSLWMDVSGDGLVGAYTREGNYQAELFRADNDILYLLADNPFGTIGLQTSTGADVRYITAVGLNIGTINHLVAFENPATWLEPYAGTYDDQSAAEYIRVRMTSTESIDFQPTSVTIAPIPIPEPGTIGLLALGAGLSVVGRRRKKRGCEA